MRPVSNKIRRQVGAFANSPAIASAVDGCAPKSAREEFGSRHRRPGGAFLSSATKFEQLNLAQTVVSQKPDALLLSPQSDSNLAPVIKAAIVANTPTVIIDDARTSGQRLPRHGPGEDRRTGRDLPARYKSQRRQGRADRGRGRLPNARARIKGFKEQLATYPDLQLVASQSGNWDRLTALKTTSNGLRQNPDLIGIYTNNDRMKLGVFEVVKSANAAVITKGNVAKFPSPRAN
jgi:ribose transport system substrate-binding protein